MMGIFYTEQNSWDGWSQCAEERVKTFIKPTDGTDGQFELRRAEPYVNHQRVAATARKGRVVLAEDALHSNNPIGGLGLTSGIRDALCYGNALIRVTNGGEDDKVLIHCSELRRWTWINATKVMSEGNLKRIQSDEPEEIKRRKQFFKKLDTYKAFPAQVKKRTNNILIDTL